jgi:ABC-type molybdate transport system permease subunit
MNVSGRSDLLTCVNRRLTNATVLHSLKAAGINQKIWGFPTTYNLIRLEISQIAQEAIYPAGKKKTRQR